MIDNPRLNFFTFKLNREPSGAGCRVSAGFGLAGVSREEGLTSGPRKSAAARNHPKRTFQYVHPDQLGALRATPNLPLQVVLSLHAQVTGPKKTNKQKKTKTKKQTAGRQI